MIPQYMRRVGDRKRNRQLWQRKYRVTTSVPRQKSAMTR